MRTAESTPKAQRDKPVRSFEHEIQRRVKQYRKLWKGYQREGGANWST
jgi:hypothetical protein